MSNCPCGSDQEYSACCEPIIGGEKTAETAEQMMRARYSAHVKVDVDFIYNTTHPAHREGYDHKGTKTWAENSDWAGLQIIETTAGGADDETGEVEFIASFRDKEGKRNHHELGHFVREKGQWLFTDGDMVKPKPVSVTKVGRNDPCTCGSGKKYKKCCGK